MKKGLINPQFRNLNFGEINCLTLGMRGIDCYEAIVPCDDDLGEVVDVTKTLKGNIRIKNIKNSYSSGSGWLTMLSGKGDHDGKSKSYGSIYHFPGDENKIQVFAKGHGVHGETREFGLWFDFLLSVEDKTLLKIIKTGKPEPGWIYFGDSELFFVLNADVLDFCAEHKVDFDVTCKKLLDVGKLPITKV